MLAHATLVEAVYEAKRREPDNAHVIATIEGGIMNPVMLHPNIRKDVCIYIKEEGNDWHFGSCTSVSDFLILSRRWRLNGKSTETVME